MSCLNNIVLLSDSCGVSTSGFYLLQAPEISVEALAAVANSTHQTARNLAQSRLDLAALSVQNDFLAALRVNNAMPNLNSTLHTTSEFKAGTNMGVAPVERGVVIYRNLQNRGTLRKLKIEDVQVYPLGNDEAAVLKIYDGETVSSYNVELVANQVNTFKLQYTVNSRSARVVIDNTNVAFLSAPVTCGEGCNGTLPNDCGYARGWNGYADIRKGDGYGINVRFRCECDYTELLCNLSRTYIGEIIWLKARVLLLEDKAGTDRANNWVVYGRKEAKERAAELDAEYREKWNGLIASLPNVLKSFGDDCITCKGLQWKTNL